LILVPLNPLTQVRAYFDIGGTGARADAVAIWICQFVGQKINVLDYYEAQGQELSVHLAWMRSRGLGKAWVILPHDGAHGDKVFATSYESAIREAGFDVFVIPNQGQGRNRGALRRLAGCSLACSSTKTPRKRAAKRLAGITKRSRRI
jgi:phage terminase large subunit